MELIYIYHSGFAILAEGVTVIVDYYKDSDEAGHSGVVHDELLNREGKIYVLATHFHPDHFNPEILQWKQQRPDIVYILSKDILKHRRAKADDGIFIKRGETYRDDTLVVEAFGSTDSGVSFLLRLAGKTIFHAGDLNNWHWNQESTEQEVRKAEGDYLAELKFITQSITEIDVVMFPIDARLGKDYMKGATQFVEQIKTGIFAPMHFGEDYPAGNKFASVAEEHGIRFLPITGRGQRFDID